MSRAVCSERPESQIPTERASTADLQPASLDPRLGLKVVGAVVAVEAAVALVEWWLRPELFLFQAAVLHISLATLGCGVALYVAVFRPLDVRWFAVRTELEAARRRAEHLLKTDPLTGVANRRAFFDRFDHEWDRSARYGTPLTCIMIDLDSFQQLNNTHGHVAGDAALRKIGQMLRSMCRSSDCICRYGGEEFCILLPETAEKQAADFAERAREAISEQPIDFGDGCVQLTGSFGVSQRVPQMMFPDKLIEVAGRALLRSKEQGRNRVTTASSLPDGAESLVTANRVRQESPNATTGSQA